MNIKIACCQMTPTNHLDKNLETAEKMVLAAAAKGADLVVLPEMFVCPYCHSNFSRAAEPAEGYTFERIRRLAQNAGIYLFAGTVPERFEKRIYNTCYVFDRQGNCIGHYRKNHLFDVSISGGIQFRESRVLSPGNDIVVVDTEFGPVGVTICFDLRFVEPFRIMADRGAKVIVVPAAFNMTTGPLHWDLTLRARAVDNQCFIAACSSGRDTTADYCAWGHSSIVNPWGTIVASLDDEAGTLIDTIDLDLVQRVRQELPILSSRRPDLYECVEKKGGHGRDKKRH